LNEYTIPKHGLFACAIGCIAMLFCLNVQAQDKTSIYGQVRDGNGSPVAFAAVALMHTGYGITTDRNGQFHLSNIPEGEYTLQIQYLGYENIQQLIHVNVSKPLKLNIVLKQNHIELNEVVVAEKSGTTIKKQLPYSITAIDAKPLQVQNMDVNQVLNATTGIRIREDGGLGSHFNFSLNGFSGNQVKFFLDGIPMDNFGSSLTLNNIPVNLISSIEVYKGVVPIHLGSDALGGAVNVITRNNVKSYMDASYSYGSFNTHRAAIVSRYTNEKTGFSININGFYNYSDNDYKMYISVADRTNGGKYGEPEWIKRFHDAYESKTIQVEAGLTDKKFADKLLIGLIASGNYKELQTGHNMNIVIGEAHDEDKVIIPTLKYHKKNLLTEGLDVNIFANFNIRQALSADTSSRHYDWYQNYTYKEVTSTSGEISWHKTLFRFNDHSAQAIANLNYAFNEIHSFSINNTYIHFSRVGEDPVSRSEKIPFEKPNVLKKNITGLAYYLNLLGSKLSTVFFGKLFFMESLGYEGERYSTTETAFPKLVTDTLLQGYGMASTYFFTQSTQIKLGFEKTYRLPEGYEMFGNGLGLLPNLNLKPEESNNFNIGVLSLKAYNNSQILAELGFLYRLPKNMIRYEAEGNDGRYKNLVSTKGYSIEGGIKYSYKSKLNVELNGTYQKMVHNNKKTPTGGENYLFLSQLANVPILFGNVMLGYRFDNFFKEGNDLSLGWSTLYVESFYLKSPVNGNPTGKNDIPRQVSHAANISYSLRNGRYNISLACTNLTNNALFDNWRLPKPGRAFNVKARYYFSK
jgi:outer membrane receptor protein involved in Fe transport